MPDPRRAAPIELGRDDRVLDQEDVELIDLVPVTESNGEVVFRQFQAAAAKTGIPRYLSILKTDLLRHCEIA
jgi:uncharacterized protein YbcV (DUF1398 family)